MTPKAALDNDILYKGSLYGLTRELVAAIPAVCQETLVLGQAQFVIGKRLERQVRSGLVGADKALAHLRDALLELTKAEPSQQEQSLAAELENAAQTAGLELDAGESLLCALVIHRRLDRLATGDKRAICAIGALLKQARQAHSLAGRVVCLEQLFVRMLANCDTAEIRAAVCRAPNADKAVTNCFGCCSPVRAAGDYASDLTSYIEDLRRKAPMVLVA